MEYIVIFFSIYFGIYILFLLLNIISLLFFSSKIINQNISIPVSVIVAIRNGEKSLNNLIQDLLKQNYAGQLEIILVNDMSSDKTKEIIKSYESQSSKIKYVCSSEGDSELSFKKRALDAGIKNASNEYLLFTDVDCRLSKSWVKAMASSFVNDVDYVIGFSRAKYIYGFANLFQRIDFLILMFSAKAVTDIQYPLASSGQNQAFTKSIFKKVGGYKKISNLLMGDDSIFLQLCLKEKANVVFCSDPQSYVLCRSESNWKDLLMQRMRWAGDGNIMWQYNFIFYQIMVATVISNLFVLILLLIPDWNSLIIILSIKFIIELLLFILGKINFKVNLSFIDFIFWFTINIPYVCLMCIASFFVPLMSWKKRKQ